MCCYCVSVHSQRKNVRPGKLKIFATCLFMGALCVLNCAWEFIVDYWTLEFCHMLFKMWSRALFVIFFKCLFSLFYHRSKRPTPVSMTTPRIDSPMTVIAHQKVCHTLLVHYSQSCILHTSANSILYVHAFRYFKSSTGHTFHIISLWFISWRFMCNLGLGES